MSQLPIQIMKSPGHSENILLKMKDAGRKEATVLGIMPPHLSHSIWEELAHRKRDLFSFILGITFSKEKLLLILLSYQKSGFMQELLEIQLWYAFS